MKKIIIALAATAAIGAAAPAAAQYAGGGYAYGQQGTAQLQMQLQAGIRSGAISRDEAIPLRQQLTQLMRLERLYARDGISGRERADLQRRTNSLRQGIRFAGRGGAGYGRDDERYGDRDGGYDRNNDGWDDRDSDRDGRWDAGSRTDSDRDGRWDNDSDGYGRDRGAGYGVRIGERVTADLEALPYAYRNQYRDGEGVYYRTDGRQIYQIDARTQTVVRVYAMNR